MAKKGSDFLQIASYISNSNEIDDTNRNNLEAGSNTCTECIDKKLEGCKKSEFFEKPMP